MEVVASTILPGVDEPPGPENQRERDDNEAPPSIVRAVRETLRSQLGTDPFVRGDLPPDREALSEALAPAVNEARAIGNLFVGMSHGPYMLLLRAENREAFIREMLDRRAVNVRARWDRPQGDGSSWTLTPYDQAVRFSLSFRLPRPVMRWIFEKKFGFLGRAIQFKQKLLPHIFIPYRDEDGVDYLFRLDVSEPPVEWPPA